MTEHRNDDIDAMLRAAAQNYNRPGETPRDRMWREIAARRAQAPSTTRKAQSLTHRPWFVPAVAAAVLVIGIAIGRVYERSTATSDTRSVARLEPDSTQHLAVAPVHPESARAVDTIVGPALPSRTPERPASSERVATHDTRRAPRVTPNGGNLAYRLAVVQHLAGTEAMLTSFRSAAKNGEVDAQLTAWARNLLTTTRLLQASAAQQDPTMKRLLDDLELVLVQIAQYTSAGPHRAEELELIEHSIERRGVIGKLHTTIPARLMPAGS